MAVGEAVLMANKFRGCLLGSLLGDCLGAPFEGESVVSKNVLQALFDDVCVSPKKVSEGNLQHATNAAVNKYQYTDDTAMMKCIAKSLIKEKGFNAVDMATRFVKEYFSEPRRGYGANVAQVFKKLRDTNFADVFTPASEQFGGMGSFGNGGAMRVAPVALYFHGNEGGQHVMLDAALRATLITHTHRDACNGAALQCLAVDQCLHLDPRESIDTSAFLEGLKIKMEGLERGREDLPKPTPYQDALTKAKELLSKSNVLDCEVQDELGNNISALGSVPTAIYCFLRAQTPQELKGIKTDDPVQRTLQYAISLGGDTDTIACMAGALVGAYLGSEHINKNFLLNCEAAEKIENLGYKLYNAKL